MVNWSLNDEDRLEGIRRRLSIHEKDLDASEQGRRAEMEQRMTWLLETIAYAPERVRAALEASQERSGAVCVWCGLSPCGCSKRTDK